ncbi:MAG: EpsD family peptidyl-prolyl cis-trans isomerase [Caldimonas sp.]
MKMISPLKRSPFSSRVAIAPSVVILAVAAALLGGCGEKKDKASSQTAAKVNKEEITVHQINLMLSRQRGLAPAQAASASAQVLEGLIDQELAVQKAADQKLDRDPRVMQLLDANRREIIARSYLEKIGEGAPKPTPAEVSAYYEAHPALFAQRRIYSLQELDIEAPAERIDDLKKALGSAKSFPDFIAYLKAENIKFKGTEAVRAAEQLPLANIDQFAALKDGQAVFSPTPTGARVLNLIGSRTQPVGVQAATPAIEQYLLNERKRKLIADDLRALRSAAKIEYVGDYALNKPPEKPAPLPDAPPLTSIAPPAASAVEAAPQIEVAPAEVRAASMPSGATLDKGLKGMK